MIWPFVHRARYEAEVMLRATFAARITAVERANGKLLDEMLRMKRDGFSALPPKLAPVASDPESKYLAAEEAGTTHDPLIERLMADGHSLSDARLIRAQVLADWQDGAA